MCFVRAVILLSTVALFVGCERFVKNNSIKVWSHSERKLFLSIDKLLVIDGIGISEKDPSKKVQINQLFAGDLKVNKITYVSINDLYTNSHDLLFDQFQLILSPSEIEIASSKYDFNGILAITKFSKGKTIVPMKEESQLVEYKKLGNLRIPVYAPSYRQPEKLNEYPLSEVTNRPILVRLIAGPNYQNLLFSLFFKSLKDFQISDLRECIKIELAKTGLD